MISLKILIGGMNIIDTTKLQTEIQSVTINKDVKTNENVFILNIKSTDLTTPLVPDNIIAEIKSRTEAFNPQSVEIIAGEMAVFGKLRDVTCLKSTIQGLDGLYDRLTIYYYDEVGR